MTVDLEDQILIQMNIIFPSYSAFPLPGLEPRMLSIVELFFNHLAIEPSNIEAPVKHPIRGIH